MTHPQRFLATRMVTALATGALVFAPIAAQAQAPAEQQATLAKTPWKLALPLSGTASTDFFDVTATGRHDAWAVGRTTDGSWFTAPVAKHWDGTRWSDVAPAGTGGRPAQLEAVAASGPKDVWAAGTYVDIEVAGASSGAARLPDTLLDRLPDRLANRLRAGSALPEANGSIVLQHWDGARWKPVSRPAPAEGWIRFVLELKSVGAKSVWLTTLDWNPAANPADPATAYAGHLEHWDGRTWSRTALPQSPNGRPVEPFSIAGTGPHDVWVSALNEADGVSTPLLYHFDGRRWAVRTVPVPYEYASGWVADRIVSIKRGTVHVFGKTNDRQTPSGVLSTHWDGRTWQPIPTPGIDEVNTTGADGSGGVWVAGWPAEGGNHTLLSRWDGSTWTDEELPPALTSTSLGSTVFDVEGIPGSRAVLAAGSAACDSMTDACGLLVSRGLG